MSTLWTSYLLLKQLWASPFFKLCRYIQLTKLQAISFFQTEVMGCQSCLDVWKTAFHKSSHVSYQSKDELQWHVNLSMCLHTAWYIQCTTLVPAIKKLCWQLVWIQAALDELWYSKLFTIGVTAATRANGTTLLYMASYTKPTHASSDFSQPWSHNLFV